MHDMGDSEDCEIDVCSVDDEISANHGGLTLVAAETYVSNTQVYEEQLVPLTPDDLLTWSKQKILQGKSSFSKVNHNKKSNEQREKTLTDDSKENDSSDRYRAGQTRRHKLLQNGHLKGTSPFEERFSFSTASHNEENEGKLNVEKQTTEGYLFDKDEEKEMDSDDELLDRGINEQLNRFHFESDHLAIKNNSDYHALLQTLAILEAQRTQAIKDIERLHVLRDDALADPLTFVKNLQENKLQEFPKRQAVATLPEINWIHYMMAYSGDKYVPQITTRKAVKTQEPDNIAADASEMECWDESSMDSLSTESIVKFKSKVVDGKPATHKQKWSLEEQEKLEKLLLLYPPEEVEARRWEKIAKALGTRTPQQVSSRIQKYFLKLAKAKLPIPGRGPSGTLLNQCKKSKINPVSYKNSSFFPSWQPNVYMNEDDKGDIGGAFQHDNEPTSDEDEAVPEELKQTPEYQELMQLKKIKKYRALKDENNQSKPEFHRGYMCDGCKLDPIIGVRWHCMQCPPDQSTDFCNTCRQRPLYNEVHKEDHQLIPVYRPMESGLDNDYMSFEQKNRFKYNYLDPNFIPCR